MFSRSRSWLWLGLVVLPLLAVLARVAYDLTLPPRIVVTFEADPLTYDQIARNLVAGRGFAGASFYYPPGTETSTSFWDPLYPIFLAAIYFVFGHSIVAVRLAQALLGGAAVALTYLLGRRLSGEAVGLLAAAISAVYPFFIYYSGHVLTETLFMALILGVFVAGLVAADTARTWWFLALGAVSGLAALCRAEAYLFGLVFLAWAAWRAPASWRTRVRLAALALVALYLVMLPWGIRNQITEGKFILTTTKLGYNLYKYYHPTMTADQTVATVPFPDMEGLTEPQRAALMQRLGTQFMFQDPRRTAWFMLNKLALLFKLTPSNEVNRRYALISVASFGVLLPFMAAGLVIALKRGGRFLPVAAYVLFSVATKAAVFAGIRLRMQIEPFLILLASLALVALAARVSGMAGLSRWSQPATALPTQPSA